MTEEETNGTDDRVHPDSNAPIWWCGNPGLRSELFVFYQDEQGLHTCSFVGDRRNSKPDDVIRFASGMEPRGLSRAEALADVPTKPRIVVQSEPMVQRACYIFDIRAGDF
jgi:hypothetical protein